jgi:anti-sigma-K factor RskA
VSAHSNDHEAQTPPAEDILAGEYVLGVLDAKARRTAQARIAEDPAFAGEVERWQRHFDTWLLEVEPVRPSDLVLPAIKARLGWPREAIAKPRLWENVALWRSATALAAAAAFAAIVIGLPWRKPPARPVAMTEEQTAKPVTVLLRDDGTTGWIASIDVAHAKVLMVPVPSPADASGRVDELWIIGAGKSPVSLGLISNESTSMIALPANLIADFVEGSTLAITLEPKTGIPHAAPSGPIIAKGGIRRI